MGIVDSLANVFGGTGVSGSTSLANRDVPSNLDQYSRVNGLLGTLDSLVKAAETAQGATGATGPVGCANANYVIKSTGVAATCSIIYDDAIKLDRMKYGLVQYGIA